jgi:hypothetical protein
MAIGGQCRAIKIKSIEDRFEIAREGFEGNIGRISIRKTDSTNVEPNEPKSIGEKME